MEASLKSTPHSVKQWQLRGTDYEARSETCFSTWTPLHNKTSNLQLYEERMSLVFHWFDLWSDKQRKHFLHSLLTRCTNSQLRYCRDLLIETVPVTQVDFTVVLPRFLSLYVMSFLTPRDLCNAAQVSWHWRILAEQDCVWADRCMRRGWFLPYAPSDKEFGAWKNHYISCVSTLDWLTPREAAERYGTLNQQTAGITQEEEEKRKERRIRQLIRDRLEEGKKLSMRTRRPWGSYPKSAAVRGGGTQTGGTSPVKTFSSWPSLSSSFNLQLSLDKQPSTRASERVEVQGSSSFRAPPKHSVPPCHSTCDRVSSQPVLLLLVSNRIPAYELVLSGVKAEVIVVLYDHRGSLSALFTKVKGAVSGQNVQRLGLLAPGGTEEICLLHGCSLSQRTLLAPHHREFWEHLCGLVVPAEEGGGIDIFCPLASSASGVALMQNLLTLTGLEVQAPMGFASGGFQNILSEWSDGSLWIGLSNPEPAAPALQYISDSVLLGWCRQAQWMEEALQNLRGCLESQLHQVSLQARGRALGYFLNERICLEELNVSKDLSEALTEGITAVSKQDETTPIAFLVIFLTKWMKEKEEKESDLEENSGNRADNSSQSCSSRIPQLPQMVLDWRGAISRDLHHSECVYLGCLSAVLKVYYEPLKAAMNSNRAILSYSDIQIIFNPVTQILELSRGFQVDLQARLQQWSAEQCVGDVFVKLCSSLRVYTNYLNNYTTAVCTIDKCRETKPSFRAFLKTVDRTLATHMLSLQELLLCPMWRIQVYVTLLQALCVHTPPAHPDHTHLSSALNTMQRYREFTEKLKRASERDTVMAETQQMIQGCPNLSEGNRQLIITQHAALLRCPDERIPDSLRTYEHVSDVGLFLFSDALVLTQRKVLNTPYKLAHRSTHTFLASVALTSLNVREITCTRYVCHAFVLEGPSRSWVCSTNKGEERDHFLSVLRLAKDAALASHQ